MSESKIRNRQTAHLTHIMDKQGELMFVQLSAPLWQRLALKWDHVIRQELELLYQEVNTSHTTETNTKKPIEMLQAEQLSDDTFVRRRFKNAEEHSQEIQYYLNALRRKINDLRPAR